MIYANDTSKNPIAASCLGNIHISIYHVSYIIDHTSLVDPALSHKGRWAIPALLHRWWADVGAALQAANAEAILASLGFEGGAGAALAETDAAAFELLLPLASA